MKTRIQNTIEPVVKSPFFLQHSPEETQKQSEKPMKSTKARTDSAPGEIL